jgi:hypothetical protein
MDILLLFSLPDAGKHGAVIKKIKVNKTTAFIDTIR